MSTPTFAATQNLVAFLEKPTESNGFERIIDFLNPKSIKYALTVNPTVYTSCIKQFWATARVNKVNGQDQIQALVDKQKVMIMEESIRSDIHFDDAKGTVCLPNDVIFEELAKMGYEKPSQRLTFYKAFFSPQWKFLIHTILQCLSAKTTAWNKFSSTMASTIIYLANNQKFNFSKYILDNMVKNLEGGVKFFMFPRFLQVFLNKQVDGMNKHKETFVISSHTKKVFANIRRQSDGFSRVVTPLFDNMLIQASKEIGEDLGHPTNSTQIPIDDQPSTSSAPKKKQKSKRRQRKEAEVSQDDTGHEENEPTPSNDPQPSGKDRLELTELMKRVKKLERKRRLRPTGLRRLKKVGAASKVESSEEIASLGDQEDPSKQGRKIAEIDQDENVNLIDETQEQLNNEEMFGVNDLHGEEVIVEDTAAREIVTAAPIIPVTTAETIIAVTTDATSVTTAIVTRPKAKGIGKGIMIEPERPLKIKDQIAADEELARQLEAEMQAEIEEERTRRKKEEEANLALIKLQTREREELSIEEKSKLFVELMNKRRKHFAELRAQEKRKKPPTKAHKRSQMSTYLKHMGNYKHSYLKSKTYKEIEKLFEKEMKRVNSFIPMDADDRTDKEQERISKRGGDDLQSNVSKKQKVDEQIETKKVDDLKEEEMKKHIEVVREDNIVIDAVPLASKPPTIVDYKIIKAGIIGQFQLIREDGSSKRYAHLYASREEISPHTNNYHTYAQQKASSRLLE
ncbi:hypothetical protein Tco_0747394 [Tanacetum coccineum]|uniref:Uncharacterized protein n=1 Tax=Tanacetum coccineum TaxID=301880 RepID=A0ABQ4YVM5_9ASTR